MLLLRFTFDCILFLSFLAPLKIGPPVLLLICFCNSGIILSSISKKLIVKRNLIQIIETILASYEMQEKYSTKLTPFGMITIGELIKKKPEFFRMVESTLVRNIHGNKIKAEDVPYIISIISNLHTLLLLIKPQGHILELVLINIIVLIIMIIIIIIIIYKYII